MDVLLRTAEQNIFRVNFKLSQKFTLGFENPSLMRQEYKEGLVSLRKKYHRNMLHRHGQTFDLTLNYGERKRW